MKENFVVFKRYPFSPGQKIHIEDGPRKGDWLVKEVKEKTVTLQCPVSGFIAEWSRFCYQLEERFGEWPDTE